MFCDRMGYLFALAYSFIALLPEKSKIVEFGEMSQKKVRYKAARGYQSSANVGGHCDLN